MSPPAPPSDPGASGRLRLIQESQHDTGRPGPLVDETPPADAGELALRQLKAEKARRIAIEQQLALEIDRVGDAAQTMVLTTARLEKAVGQLEGTVSSLQGERLDVHQKLDEHAKALARQANLKYWLLAGLSAAEAFREGGGAKLIGAILKALGG